MIGQEEILQIKGFKHGLISDGEEFPSESVQDCSNLDFEPMATKRRKPYHYNKTIPLTSGYAILGLYNKIFTDGTGTEKEVIVLVVRKSTTPFDVKIYVSDWYYPTSSYGNSKSGTAGWSGAWTEITKTYTGTISAEGTSGNTGQGMAVTGNAELQGLADNELRGWFLAVDGVIQGQVTKYVANNGGDSEFYIARSQKIATSGSEPKQTLELLKVEVGNTITLYRFPVVLHNAAFFTGEELLSECTFAEFPNGVRITCGTEGRVLWLGFLTEKQFFGTASDINSGDYLYTADWNGFWFDYDIPDVKNKDIIYHLSSADGANDPTAVDGLVLSIQTIKKDTGSTSTTSRQSSGGSNALTFYNKDDFIELGIILKPKINYYSIIDDTDPSIIDTYWVSQMVGLCIELDGMQALYLKHIFGQRQVNTSATPDARNLCNIELGIVFNPEFDRRYTAILQYYGKGGTDNVNNFQTSYDFTNFAVYQLPDANYGRSEHYSTKHTLVSSKYYDLPVTLGDNQLPLSAGNNFHNNDFRVGLTLKSYLNMNFWKDVWVKAKKIIQLGEDNIAIHLSDDSVSTDTLQDKRGAFKVAISNLQNAGGSNTTSIYSDERVKQITMGDKLITGSGLIDNQFLLWTNKDLYYYTVADNIKGILQLHQKFDNYGTYSDKTVIRAQVGGQFAGIYWIGKSSIYRFLDNHPEDLLENRWKDEFELYTEAEKALAVMGVLPRTRDIFIVMPKDAGGGSYTYKIFIWSVKYEHWRKYTYTDTPKAMINSKDDEMWFLSGTNNALLFKTATPAEAAATPYDTRDATPVMVDIIVMLDKIISHGSRKTFKIPSRVELSYRQTVLGEADTAGTIKITGRSESSSSNDILVWSELSDKSGYGSMTVDITAGYTSGSNVKARKSCRWYGIKVETIGDATAPVAPLWKEFILDELIIAAQEAGRTLNR